jgi:hypothetical protein
MMPVKSRSRNGNRNGRWPEWRCLSRRDSRVLAVVNHALCGQLNNVTPTLGSSVSIVGAADSVSAALSWVEGETATSQK